MPVVYVHEVKACYTCFLHAAAPYIQAWTMAQAQLHDRELNCFSAVTIFNCCKPKIDYDLISCNQKNRSIELVVSPSFKKVHISLKIFRAYCLNFAPNYCFYIKFKMTIRFIRHKVG